MKLFNIHYRKINPFLILIFSTFFVANIHAQVIDGFVNPTFKVNIPHPPELGLQVDKVVFNPGKGNCTNQVINELISVFVSKNVEVIDRDNLQAILYEHDLNLSGYIDKSRAVSIGKILGPSAMITVKVLNCNAETKADLYEDIKKTDPQTEKVSNVRNYIAQTKFHLKASIQVTDLTTGRIFAARILEYSPMLENRSSTGRPAVPSEYEVQQIAMSNLVTAVHNLFFTWTETTKLYFMDSKKGGLKEAALALEAGNIDLAYELSKKNLEYCRNNFKDKTLSHAYYNMGMMHFIRSEYDKAIENFEESEKIRPSLITKESLNQTKKAIRLMEEIQRIDEEAAIEIEKSNEDALQTQKKTTITNDDIIFLTQKNLSSALIIQKIKTSNCNFDTSTDALLKLTEAGVNEQVILMMMER